MIVRLAIAVAVLVAALAVLFWSQQPRGPLLVSGYIEAEEIRVGSRVGGRVGSVHVEEGQQVDAGAVLVELEPFDLREQKAQAGAVVAQRRAELERLEAGFRVEEIREAEARRDQLAARVAELEAGPRPREIAVARALLRQAEADLDLARQEFERAKELEASRIGSGEVLDRATSRLKAAEATVAVRTEELGLLEEGTRSEVLARARAELREGEAALELVKSGSRREDIAAAASAVEAAGAALAALDRRIAELTIAAPSAALVEAMELEPGDLVAAGAPVLSLVDMSDMWVRAYVPENRLDLRVGDRVEVMVDSFPGESFPGRVSFVARGAEFVPRNVQTPEERSKQVFRIKVTLEGGLDRLRPGMAADVVIGER